MGWLTPTLLSFGVKTLLICGLSMTCRFFVKGTHAVWDLFVWICPKIFCTHLTRENYLFLYTEQQNEWLATKKNNWHLFHILTNANNGPVTKPPIENIISGFEWIPHTDWKWFRCNVAISPPFGHISPLSPLTQWSCCHISRSTPSYEYGRSWLHRKIHAY